MKQTFDIAPWHVKTTKWSPEDKRLQESMTSLANENLGMRGFFEEGYSADKMEGVYLGGVWFPDKTRVGWWKNGYPKYFGKMINAVNFLKLPITVNGEALDLAKQTPSDFSLDLDMQRGTFTRTFTATVGGAKMRFEFVRFVSAVQKELVGQQVTLTNLSDQAVQLEVTSAIDGDVYNEDANYDEQFWDVLDRQASGQHALLVSKTKPNDFGTPQFTVAMKTTTLTALPHTTDHVADKEVANVFAGELAPQASLTVEKRTVVATSRDFATEAELLARVDELTTSLADQSFADLLKAHEAEWQARWDKSDVKINGDEGAQQGIRFNLFQLFSTYYGNDYRLNISPKGFTGEKYGGATYWDTEAYCLPVYLGVADPEISRNLLMYRYNQLDGAYINAQEQGLKGALYPMVTFNGIECHNEWEITFEEIHRNGDVAYAIYNYTNYTGDKSYVLHEGAKVLTEISRFWADRVHYSQRANKYMLHGVTGPDEYDNNVNNDWYTNLLCQWTLKYTLEVLAEVDAEVAADLAVTEDEKRHWKSIVDNMYLPYDEERRIFPENDGFMDKDLIPVGEIPSDQLPLNQNWSWDKILRSPYVKQGDVIQGIWDFMDDFTPEEKKRNFDFYEQFTVHESSLSASVYSVIAADIGYEDKAVEMYERSARLDLDNYNNDTADGLHITSMTGSWIDIVQGFAGMRVRDGQLHYAPFLPKKWDSYQFRQQFRGRVIEVTVDKDGAKAELISGEPLTIDLAGEKLELK
ncbi:glycoside hydrolase family 65 protein [Limosilactobacillus ingluviei]|uniref:glycoside hydrolase family 65 protein n=1 Tax=Limosilactobacillus ingluviei TaxID=148604 RepID=UPI0003135BA4|nr:glycoside hydrolase family 65 protein [Limosilactobacillus ingluviei]MBM6728817.1 glycoside hydrolase family 65 protein [Limosilactobacillus ingluviei]MDO4603296.1 glycoside hydrolase family 65 protein [Limosilactobacillus ingluviei]HJG50363.1 glycoside hydrolase family 65 protein [Limosilactobacillus ingluviei]